MNNYRKNIFGEKGFYRQQKTNIFKLNVDAFLYVFFVICLPFFNFRYFSLNISPILIVASSIIVWGFFSLIVKGVAGKVVNTFDFLVFCYICVAAIFVKSSSDYSSFFVLSKTIFYFIFYLSLKLSFWRMGFDKVVGLTVKGIYLGTVIFFVMSMVVLLFSKFSLSSVEISYYGFTIKFFDAFLNFYSNPGEVAGTQVMRNAIGEVFAFYAVLLMLSSSGLVSKVLVFFNSILMMLTFSRRAAAVFVLTALVFPFLGGGLMRFDGQFKRWASLIIILGIFLCFAVFVHSRVMSLDDSGRFDQYSIALSFIKDHWLFGAGYPEKVDGKYVHNFLLASLYMMGVLGFILSILIFLYLFYLVVLEFFSRNSSGYGALLFFPIFGLMVGSTVEGLVTPIGWLVLAIFFASNRRMLPFGIRESEAAG